VSDAPRPSAHDYRDLLTRTTLVVAVVVGIGLVAVGLFVPLATRLPLVANGIGCGILASVIVYVLVSLRLDPVRQREQMDELVSQVNTIWYQQFHQRFQDWLPEVTYSASDVLRRDLRDRFVELLRRSERYYVKGATADYTTFRLVALASRPHLHRLSEVRLFVLDPQADRLDDRALRAYAVQRLQQRRAEPTNDAIERERQRLRGNIYTSIVALFDIRHSLPVSIYFHSDLPFNRCEMFDGGMFLTYYQANSRYPPAFLFSANSSLYGAYRLNIELTRRFRTGIIDFDRPGSSREAVDTEEKLTQTLRAMGCDDELNDLRAQRDARFAQWHEELANVHLSANELF
jgi:hypothetical protein